MNKIIKYDEDDIHLKFETNNKVFSPKGIDRGTLSMLSVLDLASDDKVLDIGCGYGFVGIYISQFINPDRITMSDISEDAITLAKLNSELNGIQDIKIVRSDGFNNIEESGFSIILSNPPYHEDFSVPKKFIEEGYKKMIVGGKLYMVTKRREWYKNKLISVFGGTKIIEINGYYVFISEKKAYQHTSKKQKDNHLSKKLFRKYKK